MNLVEGIRTEQQRVREVLIPRYEELGQAGAFGLLMLRRSLARSERALAADDLAEMIRSYQELEGCE